MSSAAHIVALLPMKGNSERVKGKNFRPLAGKPLFWWMVETLLAVEEIAQVVINTDARDILAQHGLEDGYRGRVTVRDRKPEICGDFVSMNLVLADDVAAVPAERYVMTHTTNPLLSTDTIRRCLAAYDDGVREGRADS